MFSPTPVTLYRITCESDLTPAVEVTVLDLLRLLVREKATHPQAHTATGNALSEIIRNPEETIAASDTRPTDAFGA